jgi:hypothetical protein
MPVLKKIRGFQPLYSFYFKSELVIPACPESLFSEGFPTHFACGNDRFDEKILKTSAIRDSPLSSPGLFHDLKADKAAGIFPKRA